MKPRRAAKMTAAHLRALASGTARIVLVLLLAGSASAGAGSVPVVDGGFENGPPPSSLWSEVTNSPTDCASSIGDWGPLWGLAAVEGGSDYWAGGYCDGVTDAQPIEGGVGQALVVPASTPVLTFYYAAYRVDPDDAPGSDIGRVMIDTTTVWSIDASSAAANTFDGSVGGFVAQRVDLCAWAGLPAVLAVTFEQDEGDNVGNVRFDDFGWADGIFLSGFECGLARWQLSPE